jgi:demethylmenaquinone methyltransferase/2-methoxy-6-polyprenyl-1,4-benzoquinol methylase
MTDPRVQRVHRFFGGTGSTYDSIANLCTFGCDGLWKKRILSRVPKRPSRIMDQACGTGILTLKIAGAFPNCHVIGVELRDEYLRQAREKAREMGIANVDFILSRAEDILVEDPLDCITASYLAKYADLALLIRNASKMLREGGALIMHDFTLPSQPVSVWFWEQHFRLLQTFGTWRYPEWRTTFYELPELIRETKWVGEVVDLLGEHSFSDITIESLTLGTSAIVRGMK